ncbi:MAG: STM4014 family protein [Tannerellaceae bacterium]|jgi:glutathione synthase/RimK-type ligase-like ATP-grasp enzyme|nr:STM4014 family protein [Tannerellaceae bacterium]
MQAVVVSNEPSQRTAYFIKAGEYAGVNVRFITYRELEQRLPAYRNMLIKLEPPLYHQAGWKACHALCMEYIEWLRRIARLESDPTARFLNRPEAIVHALDKAESKRRLAGLRTTPLLSPAVEGFHSLVGLLSEQHCSAAFIKPRFGSGAAGILALRYHKKKGRFAACTTLAQNGALAYNTRRINRLTDTRQIAGLVNTVAETGALAERWIPKDSLCGETYDLRVVCQFDRIACLAVRCSKGAITNLHLNNKALPPACLRLPAGVMDEIKDLCIRATRLSALQYAGIDVLIEKDAKRPYIIEVNGQGDHIRRDLYDGNTIYKNQLMQAL